MTKLKVKHHETVASEKSSFNSMFEHFPFLLKSLCKLTAAQNSQEKCDIDLLVPLGLKV